MPDTIAGFFGQGASAKLVPAREYEQGLLRFAAGHPEVAAALAEFRRSPGTVADLAALSRRYADALPDDDPRRPAALMRTAVGLRQLFLETDDPDVPYDSGHADHFRALFEAVAYARRAVGDDPARDPQQVPYLDDFSRILNTAYDRVASRDLLLETLAVNRRAEQASADDTAEHAAALSRLAYSLHRLYDHNKDSDALAEAIAASRRAIAETATGDPELVTRLADMCHHLTAYYEVTQDTGTLREEVEFRRRAVEAASPGDRLHYQLNRLFGDLQRLSGATHDIAVLAEQVTVGRRVLAGTAPGSAERFVVSNGIAGALRELSWRTRDIDKLREAIDVRRQAVEAASDDQLPDQVTYLIPNLVELFERTDDVSALDEAAATARQAVSASHTTEEHARALAALGVVLAITAEHTGDAGALNEAATIADQVAATFPDGHPAREAPEPTSPRQLLTWLRRLYQECVYRDLVVKAAATFAPASGALPSPRHIMHAQGANLGAVVLGTLSALSGDPNLNVTAREHLAAAAESPIAPVGVRIEAAARGAAMDMTLGDYTGAIAAVERAAELLPMFATRLLSRSDRERQLAQITGIGSLGAAARIAAGQTVRAVEFLEQCRGLLLAEAMDSRQDLSGLRVQAPDLAEEFNRLRELLQSLETSHGPRHAAQRRAAATQWEELLARIRVVPGQANFLRPPSIHDLQRHAADGPIVMITVSEWRCDALIITPDPARPVRHVPLPNLSYEETVRRVEAFRTAMTTATGEDSLSRRAEAQRDIHATLEWLWDTTAEPILSSLGYADSPGQGAPGLRPGAPWPRLWWCPTGPLAYLPLHAAGHHGAVLPPGAAHPRTVLDRVVSSYIPSARSLAYARRPGDPGAPGDQRALIVVVPDAPGAPPLPGAPAEAEQVRACLPNADVLSGAGATRSAVLAALPAHGIVHFACHGLVDAMPSASTLVLHDHDTRPLDVAAISRLELTVAELAYLSACTTSQTAPRLADESIHITSAFQLAGYRHVVGTLYPISDYAATRLARYFYADLTEGTRHPGPQDAAHALHQATRRLRSEGLNIPSSWASPVHVGA